MKKTTAAGVTSTAIVCFLFWLFITGQIVDIFRGKASAQVLIVGVIVALAAWFFEIWIDNNFARVKWQAMLKWAWVVALVCGGICIVA